MGLTHAADKKVRAYSLGMKQRLGIANALLAPRELLVLDEPTNGLDPQGTREVRSLVRSLAADGATVFVSSHLLAEVEQICTHAAIMSAGRLVAQGTLADLRGAGQARIRVLTPDPGTAAQVLAGLGLAATLSPDGGGLSGGAVPDGAPSHRSRGAALHRASACAGVRGSRTAHRRDAADGGEPGSRGGCPRGGGSPGPRLRDRTGQPRGPLCRLDGGGVRRCPVTLHLWTPRAKTLPAPAAGDTAGAAMATAPPVRRRSVAGGLLASELGVLFRRRRTWAMLCALAAIPVLIAVAVRVSSAVPAGRGPAFLDRITQNGLFVGVTAMVVSVPLFLPLTVGVVAGDTIAGEAGQGTLRYLLVAPAGRIRLLLVKYAGAALFVVVAPLVVALTGAGIGAALFPVGPVTLLSGDTIGTGEAVLRLC